MSQSCGLPSTTEPGVPPVFGFDRRGRAKPLAAVRRPPTGNSYAVLGRLAENTHGAAGEHDADQHHADEGGADEQQPNGGARAKKPNKRQRLLRRQQHGGVPAGRASTGWWCIATGWVILCVLLLLAYLPAAAQLRHPNVDEP